MKRAKTNNLDASENNNRQSQVKTIRTSRKIHRTTSILVFFFLFVIAITGILLGWKKNSDGQLLPKSVSGTSTELSTWLPVDLLHQKACKILQDSVSPDLSTAVDRIDIRKDHGMVKFVFKEHFWEVQLDGSTGEVLQIGKRRSDIIEKIHDGSIFDHWFKTKGSPFKLIYTTIMSIALLTFTTTGMLLWLGPKRLRRGGNNRQKKQP